MFILNKHTVSDTFLDFDFHNNAFHVPFFVVPFSFVLVSPSFLASDVASPSVVESDASSPSVVDSDVAPPSVAESDVATPSVVVGTLPACNCNHPQHTKHVQY